jgi:hydrogenase maturation protein HypF
MTPRVPTNSRVRAHIEGVVQGVGFRPFLHQLATRHGLAGWVLNATDGVTLEVEGPAERVQAFLRDIPLQKPKAAAIDQFSTETVAPLGEQEFRIRASVAREGEFVLVSPDLCVCEPCLAETADPHDRRYRYPFTNCTDCGPRFTLIEDLPYDRPRTTMAPFVMCADCAHEYENPSDRRYHAQPNACPVCGPQVWLEPEPKLQAGDAIEAAARLLEQGRILAIRGLGGFHLACDATNEDAVRLLRQRKGREEKPFAMMAASVQRVAVFCEVAEAESELLESVRRPVVLLQRKPDARLAQAVAPGNRYLGFMLPYTPLHAILLSDVRVPALVMTSANLTDEPICRTNDEARHRLKDLADAFLLHNREIRMRCDDSVARVALVVPPSGGSLPRLDDGPPEGGTTSTAPGQIQNPKSQIQNHEMVLRRSRGYAPFPVRVDFELRQVLACGAELKNTFCFSREHYLFLSQHIGDLQDAETADYYREALDHFRRLFRLSPEALAHDLHPDYVSTRVAQEFTDVPLVAVQHHHAHIASAMAEHGFRGPVLGLAFDGLGLGPDRTVWGGEFLLCTAEEFHRVGHLRNVPLPGGDAATREPWRMALSHLLDVAGDPDAELPAAPARRWPEAQTNLVRQMIRRTVNAPLTSSAGRLFDAVSSLLGLRDSVRYEGQAAIELEMHATTESPASYPLPLHSGEPLQLDTRPLIAAIVNDAQRGIPTEEIAGRFHASLARAMAEASAALSSQHGVTEVALSGGVFQNALLLRHLVPRLEERGLRVFLQQQVPCNDGGLAVGQALIADALLKKGEV